MTTQPTFQYNLKKKEGVEVEANPTRKLTGQRTRALFKPLLSPDTNGSIITAISLFMIVTKNQRTLQTAIQLSYQQYYKFPLHCHTAG